MMFRLKWDEEEDKFEVFDEPNLREPVGWIFERPDDQWIWRWYTDVELTADSAVQVSNVLGVLNQCPFEAVLESIARLDAKHPFP
jgi:hypothetical protein